MKSKSGWEVLDEWVVRIIIYAVAAAIIIPLAFIGLQSRLEKNINKCNSEILEKKRQGREIPPIRGVQAMAACLQQNNIFLENWLLRTPLNIVNALPNAPCKYVGVWHSTQPHCKYLFTLKENGEYTAERQACSVSSKNYSGYWGVHENKIVWLDQDSVIWPPDINLIEAENKNSFSIVEQNGSHTIFTRVEDDAQATACGNLSNVEYKLIKRSAEEVAVNENVISGSVGAVESEKVKLHLINVYDETKPSD